MTDLRTRRQFLAHGSTELLVGLAGGTVSARGGPTQIGDDPPVGVRGAVYLPARAFNVYQMWDGYDRATIERDLGYATRVNLNALRIWLNYEFWQEDPSGHEAAFDHFLNSAASRGIRVVVGLFEAIGRQPTREYLTVDDPWDAVPVQSPGKDVITNPERWDDPREFVEWFMEGYRDDERLLALEVMNEPGWFRWEWKFAQSMFRTMVANRGSVPLTVGSTSLANNAAYRTWGCDVLQFHYNYPNSRGIYRDFLEQGNRVEEKLGDPVWLTEWQRVASYDWDDPPISGDQWQPNYASLAPVIREAGLGNFFWSLMVKPAHKRNLRRLGRLNGLFHEDGAVWSLEDARAIKAMSGSPTYDGEERRRWPEWAIEVKERAFGDE
jgi:hypothetical protein